MVLRPRRAGRTPKTRAAAPLALLALCLASTWSPLAAAEAQPTFACAASDGAASCAALGALYAATDGARWAEGARGGGWANAAAGALRPPLCTLAGVGCSAAGDLTSLTLSGQGLRGALPPSLGALRGLRLLDLSHNALDGPLSPALLNLSATLETLALNNNRLAGQLPEWLGAMAELRVLSLGVNFLRGPLPTTLALMRDLSALSLHDNPLGCTVPDDVGDMASLELLELHFTGLVGSIPAALGRLSALTALALQNNDLMGDIPEELSRLPKLSALLLFDNMLHLDRPAGWAPPWVANSSIAVLRVGEQRALPPPPPVALAAYCEALRRGAVAQPVDSYSNIPFVLLGAHQVLVGLRDATPGISWRVRDNAPRLAMRRFALFSLLNGAALVYAGICSFLFHADLAEVGQQLDMGAVLLVLSVPGLYTFWRLGVFGPPHAPAAHLLFAAASASAAVCLFRYKEALRESAGGSLDLVLPLLALMIGTIMAWAWLLGSPAEAAALALPPLCSDDAAASCKAADCAPRRAWMRRALPRGLRYRYAVVAAAAGGAGFAARQMDVQRHVYCYPRSAFQLHAAWHVLAAVSLYALWRFLRSEEEAPDSEGEDDWRTRGCSRAGCLRRAEDAAGAGDASAVTP